MSTEGLTKEQAEQKLTQNNQTLAALEEQSRKSKETILRLAIGAGKSDGELLKLGFEQELIDSIRNKNRREKDTEEIKKIIAEKAEETKKINEEQVEDVKFEIKWQLEQKEKEEEKANAATTIGKKLRAAGLREKDFESIPEWANFTEPQKMLIIEQASQSVLSNVKQEGEKRFQAKYGIKASLNPMKWRPSIFKKIIPNISKSLWISKQEKEAIQDFRNGKLKPDQETLQTLTERMVGMNLKVIDKEGKPSIEFIQIGANTPDNVKEAINKYNEIANEFSKMPDAWKNERVAKSLGGKKNFEKYIEIEHDYKEAKEAVIDAQARQYAALGSDPKLAKQKAQLEIVDTDLKVAMMQFTNTNPDAIAELNKIENEMSFKRLANNENLWRGAYISLGYGGRAALNTFGLIAAPLTSGILGYFRSKRKAEQRVNKAFEEGRGAKTFREMTVQERLAKRNADEEFFIDKNENKSMLTKVLSGKEMNAREVGGFVDADSQIQRFENILNKLQNVTSPGEKARLISELERRVNYVQDKLEGGLINYGTENPIGKNYELLRLLSQSAVEKEVNKPNFANIPDELVDIKILDANGKVSRIEKKQLRDVIQESNQKIALMFERLRQSNEIQFDKKIAKSKQNEIVRGTLVAMGFSVLGGLVRHFNEGSENTAEVVNSGVATSASGGLENNDIAQASTDTIKVEAPLNTDTIPGAKINSDSLLVKTPVETNTDSLSTSTKEGIEVKVDNDQIVKTETTPKIQPTPKLEKVVSIPKPPIIENNLDKEIELDDKNIVTTPKISTEPVTIDESTIKTGEVSNENIDLSGARQVTENENIINTETVVAPKVNGDDIDLSGARKVPGTEIDTEKLDKYGLPPVLETETPIIVDDNIRPTETGGFNNENVGSGKVIKPTENVGGYNTGEEKGNIYPRTGAVKGGPNPESISREVPMTDREAIFTNKGEEVFDDNIENNNAQEILQIEEDPRHLENAKEIRQTFGNRNVLIDKAEYPTLGETEKGIDYNDWNTANDEMFKNKSVEFESYEDFNKERELQELFGTNTRAENVPKIIYDPVLGRNVPGPRISITQEYFREMPTWKIVEKIPAKYFMQEDFLNGNNLSKDNLDALVSKGIIKQNPLTGTYTFSHRNEVERLSLFYKKLVSSRDYEKFVDKIEQTLGNEKPIGNENMETYIKRITEKVYKADDNTLYGFKRPIDWEDRNSWSREDEYDGGGYNQNRMTRPISPTRRIYNSGGENPISPTRRIYER